MIIDEAVEIVGDRHHVRPLVITCEHATNRLPAEFTMTEADRPWMETHWAYDPGAGELTRQIVKRKACCAVMSRYSRLICDPNRHIADDDWIREQAEGYAISFNQGLPEQERERRRAVYYEPFHLEIDRCLGERLERGGDVLLLSIHTFTRNYMGQIRDMEMGVLFDRFDPVAARFGQHLREQGFRTELNEPYSGKEGGIFCAARHGSRHGVIYLELEVRNDLLATQDAIEDVAERVCRALTTLQIRGPRAA
ncbi:MAG TPA: hypothetical protein DEB46_14645 [Myxococcales bacterium]|jgi:predicted N-formylglutamate amidohydrolase|nr:hypothetical protein [Myxococcales bacterium]HBU49542.1 hypothetical protein [Myxococcales bacterium]|tara:strand:+ start:286 stop:1041 length:756 start_codon:yes stop_codon:yes gene_type:complete